jgi:RNA polymerase sigma-70 factor (ECF subfamily)
MQETFVRAYTHLAGFEGRSRFSTWLMAIAINQALMCLRKRQKREVRIAIASDESQEISVPDIQDIRPNAEERALREEFARALGKATEGLPHPLRLVFRMRLLEEMSTEEAAVALGLSVSAVKSRLVRARRYLRQQLAEH